MKSEQDELNGDGWRARVGWMIFAFVAVASVMAAYSQGRYHDDLAHYQIARWVWDDPRYLLHIWGRPGCTAAYALAAWIGSEETAFLCCRFLTIAMAALSAWLTAACARKLGMRRPEIAVGCLLVMPLYFHLSYSVLTETVCGLYLIGGTYLLLAKRPCLAAMLFGLAPLARQEAAVFVGFLGILFLYRGEIRAFFLLFWGLAAWQGFSLLFMYSTPFGSYAEAKPTEMYGSGGPLHYMMRWGEAIGVSAVGLCLAGAAVLAARLWRERREVSYGLMVPVFALMLVGMHTVIFLLGLFAGGGYARFLLPGCPWMALCVAACIERLWFERETKQHPHPSPLPEGEGAKGGAWVLLIVAGVALVNLGLRVDAYGEAEWPQWRWPHWSLMIAWWVGTAMAAASMWYVARPGRVAAVVILAVAALDAAGGLALVVRPHTLSRAEAITQQGVEAALQAADGAEVKGISPWVDFYCAKSVSGWKPPRVDSAAPEDSWRKGPAGMIFVYDGSLTPHRISLEELRETGDELARFDLNDPGHGPDPFVVVLRKR